VDLRGHGKSLPLAAPGVHWLLEDFVEHDLPTCINYIFEKKGQKPISLIGHSMGATISLLVLGNRPEIASKVAYCMAISPSYLVDSKNPLWVQFTLKVLLGMGGVRLARFLGYAPFRKFMGFMENEATSFATELGKWAHQKEWCSSKDGHTFWEDIRRVSCKVDFLCAKGDSLWGRVNGCRSLYETCQSPQKRFVILEEEIPLDKNIGHYDSIMGSVAHNYTLPYFKTLLEENHGTIC
jgi:predicted alpha/beta hydrolase